MKTRLILALVAAAPLAAQATDGYFANGYGMKSIGMGGAAVAVAQEPFGGAVNPGAMSFLGNEWQFGVAWFSAAPRSVAHRLGTGRHRRRRRQRAAGASSSPSSASTGNTGPTSRSASRSTATGG